jgi:hypothetical protein
MNSTGEQAGEVERRRGFEGELTGEKSSGKKLEEGVRYRKVTRGSSFFVGH